MPCQNGPCTVMALASTCFHHLCDFSREAGTHSQVLGLGPICPQDILLDEIWGIISVRRAEGRWVTGGGVLSGHFGF